ncbi:hypothetical protein JCM10213_003731 [Rhodosporidiobolus nylandii]
MPPTSSPPLVPRAETRPSSPRILHHHQSFHADWAPVHPRPLASSPSASHLPAVPSISTRSPSTRTSHPHPSPLQASIAFSLSRLLSLPAFAALLASPQGFAAFEAYLTAFSSPLLSSLRLYRDALELRKVTGEAAAAARGIRDAYLLPGADDTVELGARELREAVEGLRRVMDARMGLDGTAQRALERLFEGEFEGYVKHKLFAHTKLQLEKQELKAAGVDGLGEAFVLSNPHLPDQPIVLASPAFCTLTGYARGEVVGRNCRFLQGAATSPADVAAIRNAIKQRTGITQLLLNYDRQGAPFANLLCILPLFSPQGELLYFIGGQTNITGALTASSGLVFPSATAAVLEADSNALADAFADASLSSAPHDLSAFSPAVQRAAASPSPVPDLASDGSSAHSIETAATVATSTGAHPSPVAQAVPSFALPSDQQKSKNRNYVMGSPSLSGLWKFGASSNRGGHRSTPSSSSVGAEEDKPLGLGLKQGSVEKRMEEFRGTYERVAVFRTEGRRILHTTSSFLRYLGLPGTADDEINASPLLDVDLLDLLRAPGEEKKDKTEALRRAVKAAVAEGRSLSVECGVKVELRGTRKFSSPTARGALHLSPLQDYDGQSVAYVAIFA